MARPASGSASADGVAAGGAGTAAWAGAVAATVTTWAAPATAGGAPLRILSLIPSSSSSNSVISFASRMSRISLSSLRSMAVAILLELALEAEPRRAQGEARAAREAAGRHGREQEVLGGDADEQGRHLLRDDRQLAQVAEPGVARGGDRRAQQGRVLGGHQVEVRVG